MDLFSLIKTPVLDTLFYRLSHLFACLCEYMFNYINQRSQISGSHIKFSLFNLGAACFGFALQLGIPSKSENQNWCFNQVNSEFMHAKSQEVELNKAYTADSWPCLSIDLGPFWSQPPFSLDKLNSKDCIGITVHLIWKSRMSWPTSLPTASKTTYLKHFSRFNFSFHMQPKPKAPSKIHPQVSPWKPRHLGFQGAKQGLLGAQDLHGAGGVLGQIRQAAWLPVAVEDPRIQRISTAGVANP